MSADGEIEVSVKAEGADDAADELAEGGEAAGGGGDGGLRQALRGGIIGGFLSQAVGPLLDILDPILKVLQAFFAPLASVLLRLLQPFLRLWITQLLPRWLSLIEFLEPAIQAAVGLAEFIVSLQRGLLTAFDIAKSRLGSILDNVKTLPQDIWSFLKQLPGQIGTELSNLSLDVSLTGGGNGDTGILDDPRNPAFRAGQEVGSRINISGGLDAFIEKIETDTGVDLP